MRLIGFIIITFFSLLVGVTSVSATGIGVTPAKFDLVGQVGKEIRAELIVTNNGYEPALYVLAADGLADWFLFSPPQFQLLPNQSQPVSVFINPTKSGIQAVFISVLGRTLDQQSFSAAAGLKVPINLQIEGSAKSTPWLWYFYLVSIIFLIFGLIFWQIIIYQRKIFWRKNFRQIDWLWHFKKPWYIKYINKLRK